MIDRYFILRVVVHGTLEEEAQETLCAKAASARSGIGEQYEVENQRRSQDGVAAKEVDFDLHRVAHPAKDIYIIPAFLVVVARRVIVDAHLMVVVGIEVGLLFRYEDALQRREFADLLGVEVGRFIKDETVAIAQNVGREPSTQAQATCADDWSKT